tara:strand:+ start:103 stop:540 length:438 start_codon:yes stop_codon:yes gene_type:complete
LKVSSNFNLKEFIDPYTYGKFGDSSIWFIDSRIITLAQFIRERLGKACTINNWHLGGQYQYSGFRPPQCTVGGKLSQHRFGRGIDIKVSGMAQNGAPELREDIIKNYSIYRKVGLTTIEDGEFAPTWCHIDIRETNLDELKIVKP